MIDVSKCEFEESSDEDELECKVYYFTYPKESADDFGVSFQPFDSYDGDVISLCVSLTDYGCDGFGIAVSPTVETEDCLTDCDWHDLDCFDDDVITGLLKIANRWRINR